MHYLLSNSPFRIFSALFYAKLAYGYHYRRHSAPKMLHEIRYFMRNGLFGSTACLFSLLYFIMFIEKPPLFMPRINFPVNHFSVWTMSKIEIWKLELNCSFLEKIWTELVSGYALKWTVAQHKWKIFTKIN